MKPITTLLLTILPLLLTAQIWQVSRRITLSGEDKVEFFRATITLTSTQFIISTGPSLYYRSRVYSCEGEWDKVVGLACGAKARIHLNCYGEFMGVFLTLPHIKYYFDNHHPTPPANANR